MRNGGKTLGWIGPFSLPQLVTAQPVRRRRNSTFFSKNLFLGVLQNSKFCNTFFVVIKLKYVTYPVILRYIFAFSHKFALRGSCWHHYKCASRLVRVIQHCRVCASQEGIGIALLDLPCSFGGYIQREVTWRLYNRAVAAAPLPTFAVLPQKFPQTPGASLNSVRLRGTFPLGLPEYIRQTALSCVRGPDRALRRSAA